MKLNKNVQSRKVFKFCALNMLRLKNKIITNVFIKNFYKNIIKMFLLFRFSFIRNDP